MNKEPDFKKFDIYDIVLVCGLPASGKSFFAKKYFAESDIKRVNRAEIRRMLYEMSSFGDKWSEKSFSDVDEAIVKHVEKKIIEHYIQNSIRIVIDNTSVTKQSRKYYTDIAKQNKKSIAVIFINTPVQTCIQRNRSLPDSKPESVISNLYASLQLPDKAEGFAEIVII